MEHRTLATDQEERELKRIGRRVASALGPTDTRAVSAARRKLFAPEEARHPRGRWVLAFAGVGAAAVIVLVLRSEPAPAPAAGAPRAAKVPREGALVARDGTVSHVTTRPDGAKELVLERGEAEGHLGRSSDVTSIAAGPYRVSGDARLRVRWSPDEGLTVEVAEGEARVLTPGQTPSVVTSGAHKTLPPR